MSSTCEVRCSPPKSRADEKGSNVSYTREVLLSLAESAACKRLPSRFDSSIMCEMSEIKDASGCSSSSDSEAVRSRSLLPEHGILGKGALLKEPKCVVGVSPRRIQGIDYHLDSQDELNNASTSFSESSSYPDSVRLDVNLSQHLKHNTEHGLLESSTLLRDPEFLAGVTAPMVEGSHYYLLNKSGKPYRPPHLYKMNLQSRRVDKDIYTDKLFPSSKCPSMGSEEEERNDKSNERKQENVSDEHKGKLDSDAASYPNNFRNDVMIVNERNQSKEVLASLAPDNACCNTSIQAAACKEKSHTSMCIFEKGLETKSLNHSPTQENCNVKADQINSCMSSSSNFVDQFVEEEKKLEGGGISVGVASDRSEVHVPANESTNKHGSRNFSSGTIAYDLKSTSFSSLMRRLQGYDTVKEKSSTAIHSDLSHHILALANEVIDEKDQAATPSKPNFSNTGASGNLGSNLTSEPIQGTGSTKEVQRKGSEAGLSDYGLPHGEIIHLPVNKTIRIDHKTATPLGSVKQSECMGSNSASDDDDDDKMGVYSLTEQKFEGDSVCRFEAKANEIDEISLPDEDSLITLDDLVFPGDFGLTPDGNPTEADLYALRKPGDDDNKSTPFNPSILWNMTLASVNQVESEPFYHNVQVRSYSRSHKNPGTKLFRHSEVRSSDTKTYTRDPSRQSGSSMNVLPDPAKKPFAESTRFDNSVLSPLSQQVIFPYKFPHQSYGLQSDATSDGSINEMLSHSQQQNHAQNFARNVL